MSQKERRLWQAVSKEKNQAAREQLIRHYLPYARVVAASYYARRTHDDIEFEEYLQFASLGLIESIDRFELSHATQFRTFAARRMHGAILDGLVRLTEKNQQIAVRKNNRRERAASIASEAALEFSCQGTYGNKARQGTQQTTKENLLLFSYLAEVGIALALGVMLEDTGMFDGGDDQVSTMPSAEISYFKKSELQRLQGLLKQAIDGLRLQERQVVRSHYLQDMSFDELAQYLQVSRSRISQIHHAALLKLKKAIASRPGLDVSG